MTARTGAIVGLSLAIAVLSLAIVATLAYRFGRGASALTSAPAPIAEPVATSPAPAATAPLEPAADSYGPAPGQSARAFARAVIEAQIADGRSMEDVRRRAFGGGRAIDYAAISEKVARQNAHFAASDRLRDWVRDRGIREASAAEQAMFGEVWEEHPDVGEDDEETIESFYDDPRVMYRAGIRSWLFDSFRAIEEARLCGSGEEHARAIVHCDNAERLLRELDAEVAEEFGPFTD